MASELLLEAQARLDADAVPASDRRIELAADMRYKGQAFELTVPAPATALDAVGLDALVAGFHDIHRRRFSYADPSSPVEIVSLRVSAVGLLPKAEGKAAPVHSERKPARHRKVWTAGAWREIAAWSRAQITPELPLKGPAVIEEAYTTVLLADGWHCRRDRSGHLIAERVQP
jgi:N-methylhydantoinase A